MRPVRFIYKRIVSGYSNHTVVIDIDYIASYKCNYPAYIITITAAPCCYTPQALDTISIKMYNNRGPP